jgi:hypothetical protein
MFQGVKAYRISTDKNHDVYDSFILALARAYGADYLITTDDDFGEPCDSEEVTYADPIPPDKGSKLTFILSSELHRGVAARGCSEYSRPAHCDVCGSNEIRMRIKCGSPWNVIMLCGEQDAVTVMKMKQCCMVIE